MDSLLFHCTCYYIVWFSCVLSAAQGNQWFGIVVAVILTMVQFLRLHTPNVKQLCITMVAIIVVGFLLDSLFAMLNVISFNANPFSWGGAPPWMIGLWINFSLILYVFFRKYFMYFIWIAFLSLFGFPLAYALGVSLGAAVLHQGLISLCVIGVCWSIFLPLTLYCLSCYIEG